ncbi:MAG: hypothetical protein E7173_00790 [Firmicutes bacterium]|nr:hypothetical protein [Bacillota bacterium]
MIDKKILDNLIVVKRSGQRVEFNSTKIVVAIKKAFDHVMPFNSEKEINKTYEDVLNYINDNYAERKTIHVEDIQDIIETKLKENGFVDVYLAFSGYRIRRANSRKMFELKQQHKFARAIERIAARSKDNANLTPNEIMLDFGKTISCEYTKAFVLDNKFVRAHEEGNLYIHNLDYFNLGKLSSTHLIFDKNIDDTFPSDLICEAINAKCEIDGEVCIDSIDELVIPFLHKKTKEKFKENLSNYLAVAGLLEYINLKKVEEIVERQSSIYFGEYLFESFILNKQVGEIFSLAYQNSIDYISEFMVQAFETLLLNLENNYQENKKYSISIGSNNSEDGKLVMGCFLNVIGNLDRLNNVVTIFKVGAFTNEEILNKVSTLISENKNIAISFIDSSYNKDDKYDVEYFSNGKRVFENYVYEEKTSRGRMIVASVSINMGRLGFKYGGKPIAEFYTELDEWLDTAKSCLITIFEIIGDKNKENYKVLFNHNIQDDDKLESGQKVRKIIKKGVLNLELAGLSECVLNLENDSDKQKELLYEIIQYVNNKCQKYTKEAKMNFVVSETSKLRPLQKLMQIDKSIYGIRKNVTDKEYYSRIDSMFEFKNSIKEDLSYIGKYQKILTGGNYFKFMLSADTKPKDIVDIINEAKIHDVGFMKFGVKK